MVGSASRRQRRSFESTAIAALAGISLASLPGQACGQTTVSYVGPNSGLWSEAINWNPAVVPANDGVNAYSVILPANKRVIFDLTFAEITGANFESGSRIDLANTSLDILGVALLNNTVIVADGPLTQFQTHAPFTSGTSQQLFVSNGATVSLELSSYIATWADWDVRTPVLSSDGAGSLLDLSQCTLVDFSGSASLYYGAGWFGVYATNSGVVDMSGATTLRGTKSSDDDWLRCRAESDGVIDLSNLMSVQGGDVWFDYGGGTIDLSSLASVQSTTKWEVGSALVCDLPALTSTSGGGAFFLASGATVNAPLLTDFRNSWVSVTPDRFFNVPAFTNIQSARIHLGEGAQFAVADADYVFAWPDWDAQEWVMSADGAGSVLDLSSVTDVDFSGTYALYYGGGWYGVKASNAGIINLSSALTVRGSRRSEDEWLRFRAESNGLIDLSSVTNLPDGDIWFDLAGGAIDLSSLQLIDTTARFDVPIFQSMNLPALTSTRGGAYFYIQNGGTVNAPLLVDFSNSYLAITPSVFWNAPSFTNIQNARIHLREGVFFSVADTEYVYAWPDWDAQEWVMSADGAGTVLDLSSVTDVDFSGTYALYYGGGWYGVKASNAGTVDLSGLIDISGTATNEDEWLRLRAETGGIVHCGQIVHASGDFWLELYDTYSRISVDGDVRLGLDGSTARVTATGGTIEVGGDCTHSITSEALHDTAGGTLQMSGGGIRLLEVAGADLGLPEDAIPNNFNWGAMIIGRDDQPTTVMLVDTQDNFNRGPNGEPEVLYLSGFPQGIDGLSIKQDSVLVLNGIQAYVGTVDGWVHLNSLFGPGVGRIPYGSGYVQLRWCPSDMNFDLSHDFFDIQQFLNYYSSGDLRADFIADGNLDFFDVQEFLNQYSAGCP